MNKFLEELRLFFWICGRRYRRLLEEVFPREAYDDFSELCLHTQNLIPFFNKGYFGGFQSLTRLSEEVFGVRVKEVTFPESVLGAYLPSEAEGQPTIFINSGLYPILRLPTISHEVCHAAVDHYYQRRHPEGREIRMKNRLSLFTQSLHEREEVFADALLAIGTYPKTEFERKFSPQKGMNLKTFWLAFRHLKKHYSESLVGFPFARGIITRIALSIHFLRLRFFVYQKVGV